MNTRGVYGLSYGLSRRGVLKQLLHINVRRFQLGLVSKAHTLLYHSIIGSKVIKKKKKLSSEAALERRLVILKAFNDFYVKAKARIWP